MSGLKNVKTRGFTLVELMIAVSVFSVVIIIGLYAFIQINNYYTKGVTIVRTQDAARNLAADIATQFQLTSGTYQSQPTEGGSLPSGLNIACVGNKAYLYKINAVESSTEHAIWSYEVPVNTCPLPSEDTSLTYLLKPGVRLLQLDITPHIDENNGPLYSITVALLYAPFDNASINSAGTDLVDTRGDEGGVIDNIDQWNCKATVSGSQYCSLSRITTNVYKRVQ